MSSLTAVMPAIARLECGSKKGTGFLVSPTQLLTAWHVVEQADTEPIRVHLPEHDNQGRLVWPVALIARRIGGRNQGDGDFALLELDAPIARDPILLSVQGCRDGQNWTTWGYSVSKRSGKTTHGRVDNPRGNVNGIRAIELSCNALAANPPLTLDGFSGAPVIVDGEAVGILLSVLGAGGATVYARDLETVLGDPVCQALKTRHEAWVQARLEEEITEVSFKELEMVTSALLANAELPTLDFSLLKPAEKMKKNSLKRVGHELAMALGKVGEVTSYVEHMESILPEFGEQLKARFIAEYRALRERDVEGDALFDALRHFAAGRRAEFRYQAAGLAVLVYLFERCEVFER